MERCGFRWRSSGMAYLDQECVLGNGHHGAHRSMHNKSTPSDDSCRCNEQAREIGGEALREVEAEQGRVDDERRGA